MLVMRSGVAGFPSPMMGASAVVWTVEAGSMASTMPGSGCPSAGTCRIVADCSGWRYLRATLRTSSAVTVAISETVRLMLHRLGRMEGEAFGPTHGPRREPPDHFTDAVVVLVRPEAGHGVGVEVEVVGANGHGGKHGRFVDAVDAPAWALIGLTAPREGLRADARLAVARHVYPNSKWYRHLVTVVGKGRVELIFLCDE